ncbi:hypothetical protein MPH_09435 [Macrophomina phaseolina MS6]|uniref:Folliculin-interacting protein N-terminal domain-containing protein n=1 Tax=Macrophomina phaseolina (strain MS6) TaxID=1126212 RepID=K2RT70_MACPH|nr:hypothetical protein MPH_09435 [Macrophomina phaseolina MS6]
MQTFEESAQNIRSRESDELVKTCLDCMFGSIPMAYRGTSNKLHIIPMEPRASERTVTSPPLQEGYSSLGRSEGRTKSRLATSYTPSNFPPEPSQPSAEASQKEVRRRTILITRLFSVSPPDEVEMPDTSNSSSTTPTPGSSVGKGNSFPFPPVNSAGAPPYPRKSSRQCRTPMYAIGIILHLPVSPPPPRSGTATQRASSKSQGGQDSLGSSFDSDRRAGWAFVDATFGVDSLLSISGNSDVDDRVDVIGQHWDVIVRTLTSLQFIVQDKVMNLFKAAEQPTPAPQLPSRTHGSRHSHREPIMPPRRMLKLQPLALLFDSDIKQAAESAADRVVRGMKVPRVVTGQGRWGVWREEARWLGRWAGGREQNFFLFNLLTAFLGTHTEWLNVLGPKSYRTKYREQQKSIAGEDITISSRTIIVSPDKMAARRLIFLLANFLPASNHAMLDGASPVRPSTSTSLRGYSQSPPNTTAAVSRQQSLRRTINRKGHKSYPNMSALNVAKSSNSDLSEEKAEEKEEKRPPSRSLPHSRRPSQVHSIKSFNASGLAIPSMVEDPAARKGSTTTTSTVTPETAVPVAHFAVHRHNSGSASSNEARPPSSGSLASVNLRHTLHRTGSGATSPSNDSSASKWGSFMSFWSSGARRESSTDHSDILQSTDDGIGIGGYRRPHNHSASKLEQMVQELNVDDFDQEDSEDYEAAANTEQNSASPGGPHSAARAIPARSKHLDSPLKLSVNENDGVIDVDIALPGFGSPIQSPLLPALGNSVGSLEGSTFGPSFCSLAMSFESQPPVNVAGWLARYHPDFALQGVQPYADLEKDVRRSMSAEPTPIAAVTTPALENGPMEKWVHICTALVADARTFTIKRLHLKRKVRLIPIPSQPAITPGQGLTAQTPGPHSLPKSQYGNPYTSGSNLMPAVPMTELHLDEKFEEETVMDLDETLADALEKGIASSGVSTPALTASTSSVNPAVSTPTQRASTIQDKSNTPQNKSRLQEQDEDVSPKKQMPTAPSVNTSTTASAAASTTASTSSSRSSSRRGRGNGPRTSNNNHQESSDAASTITSLEGIPRGNQECKSLVLGALEQVVRSVAAERTSNFMPARAGKSDGTSGSTSSKIGKHRGRKSVVADSLHKESTLREGVRRWLAQVEDGS